MLRCPQCGHERPFIRPPLLVVTGTPGVGKSTICARLAGQIPGAVLLDADVFAGEMISVVPPNEDYPAFWRSMARLAHELAQNNLAVVFFSVMLPPQLLANRMSFTTSSPSVSCASPVSQMFFARGSPNALEARATRD
jgi:hypothetical protein